MTFDEVLDQVRELLQRRGRVIYGAVKRRFDLDDAYLEDLKAIYHWFTEGFETKDLQEAKALLEEMSK